MCAEIEPGAVGRRRRRRWGALPMDRGAGQSAHETPHRWGHLGTGSLEARCSGTSVVPGEIVWERPSRRLIGNEPYDSARAASQDLCDSPNEGQLVMSTIETSRDHRESGAKTAGARPLTRSTVRRVVSYAFVKPTGSATRRAGITVGLIMGSALLAASAVIHLQVWSMGYRTIPTIGPLFLVQGISGEILAVLLVSSRRLFCVVMAAGFMIASIGGLLLSVYFGLFGFMDTLAAPYAGLSLGVEGSGVALLAVVGIELVRGHSDCDSREL
jgi:hypothetical protein